MTDGIILTARLGGQVSNAWICRPHDSDLFLAEAKQVANVDQWRPCSEAELASVDCAVGWHFPPELLDGLPNLRWIQSTSSGVDHLEEFARRHPQVIVTAMKGLNADIVAEYAVASVFALRWRFLTYYRQQQKRLWKGYRTPDISSVRVLIIGLGEVGQRIARSLAGMGMRVTGVRRRSIPVSGLEQVFDFSGLQEALAAPDYVILSLPLTVATRGLIGRRELAAMKTDAHLINLSRGGIVDEDALVVALREHRIGGAVLDVTIREPYPPDGPLWEAPNVLITPHVAGEHADFALRAARCWASSLRMFLLQKGPFSTSA